MSLDTLPILRTDDQRREHPYCKECKSECIRKDREFNPRIKNCKGIYSEEDFKEIALLTGVTEEQVREILDPSYWIWKYLGLAPHWYQDRYLRCTSTRKALRWGRRTGKTHVIAAEQIQRCVTNKGLKIVIATPVKSQALEIVTRVQEFFRENPEVGAECDRFVQQPYYNFEFKNGSRIRLFVTGSSGGSMAGSTVRGQEADILILDEMDYIDDDASAAVLPLLSDPQRTGEPIKFTVSSTPTGREGLFYRLCNDAEYKEMHVPSRYRPDWDTTKENEARKLSKTYDQYLHEYEAEWGSRTDGVYPRSKVIRASQPYRYYGDLGVYENEMDWPEMQPWAHWTYCMGVDWNGPGNGTRIVIVGFDPTRNRWIVTYREAISAEEFALHVAVDRIVQLNRLWKPYAIYIDAGFGQMQDEYLKGIGRAAENKKRIGETYEHADLTLSEHLKAIDFGSNIEYEVQNEDGGLEKKKKPMKNYMVENLQRHFELDSIWFSRLDNDLKSQLMGYIIARQGKHKELIYKGDKEAGDHDHDALLLAMFAFNQEFDPFFAKNKTAQYVQVAPRPMSEKLDPQDDMPDPWQDPRGYDLWLEERKNKSKRIRDRNKPSHNVPKRDIQVPIEQTRVWPDMVNLRVVPNSTRTGRSSIGNGIGNRNSWQNRGRNGKRF